MQPTGWRDRSNIHCVCARGRPTQWGQPMSGGVAAAGTVRINRGTLCAATERASERHRRQGLSQCVQHQESPRRCRQSFARGGSQQQQQHALCVHQVQAHCVQVTTVCVPSGESHQQHAVSVRAAPRDSQCVSPEGRSNRAVTVCAVNRDGDRSSSSSSSRPCVCTGCRHTLCSQPREHPRA